MNERQNMPFDLPAGLSLALARNIYAMEHFASLPEGEKRAFVHRARQVGSREEMQSIVDNLISH